MTSTIQTIYFDETGFTGNNLLDEQQPVFVYSSVAIDEVEASRIHTEARSLFGIRGSEIKGKSLLRRPSGREAISWVLDNCAEHVRIVYADKRFALAGKFYEYVFEPVLAANSAGFYQLEFHKFVAMLIYGSGHNCNKDKVLLDAFGRAMASMEIAHLHEILDPQIESQFSEPMQYIVRFTRCHLDAVAESFGNLQDIGAMGSWILELSATSLHMLLASWGEDFDALEVCCDMSKPIEAASDVFSGFVGRKDKLHFDFGDGSSFPITYNLAEPIGLVDSKQVPGVQIADVIASCVSFCFRFPDEAISAIWLEKLDHGFVRPIVPDWQQLDFEHEKPFVNWIVLCELVRRSELGLSLLGDFVDVVKDAIHAHNAGRIDSNWAN